MIHETLCNAKLRPFNVHMHTSQSQDVHHIHKIFLLKGFSFIYEETFIKEFL